MDGVRACCIQTVGLISFVCNSTFVSQHAVLGWSTVTIVDELFYYFSRSGRVGYTTGWLWDVLPTQWMPVSLSANGQTQCGGKLHFKVSTRRFDGP